MTFVYLEIYLLAKEHVMYVAQGDNTCGVTILSQVSGYPKVIYNRMFRGPESYRMAKALVQGQRDIRHSEAEVVFKEIDTRIRICLN